MNPKILIEHFTVSYAFDSYKGGGKESHFVSMGVKLDPPIMEDDFHLVQLQAAYKVSVSVIYDALMRGTIKIDECNERISDLKHNFELMQSKINKGPEKENT